MAAVILGVSILFALYANISLSAAPAINVLPDSPEEDYYMTLAPHYLSRPPYFPDNSNKVTKIFLVSATLQYDYSNISFTTASRYKSFTGIPAAIVNATLRNDYTVDEVVQFSQEGLSHCTIGIDVYMYDTDGDYVGTLHRGNPFRGCSELKMKSGETVSVNLVFATPNRNIDHFEIYISYFPIVLM